VDLKTLKMFHMIVKLGSFNRAAQELNYAQSTVTMQIQKLESELDVVLFERGKEVRLTEAGRLFYEQSLPIVKNMEQLKESLADLKSGDAGFVRIGVTEPAASYRLPRLLKTFLSRHPKIDMAVEISNTPHLSERVRKRELDFALCTAPGLGSDLFFEPLFEEAFVVLLPEDHPLVHKEAIDPTDFRGHRLLVTSATCPYRRKLEMTLQEHGNVPIGTMEIGSMTALKSYVECGLGIALVPDITVGPDLKGVAVRPIGGSLLQMTIGLLSHESAHPLPMASRRLYQFLRKELAGTDESKKSRTASQTSDPD
jgi:DNA-binding transcriptional LysR family regulator